MDLEIEQLEYVSVMPMNMAEIVEENYRIHEGKLVEFPFYCCIPDWDHDNRKRRIESLNGVINNGGCVVCAKTGGKIVGFASLKNNLYKNRRMQLFSLHVDRDFRNKGIGRALLSEVVKLAKDRNANGLYISAAPKKNTIDFYLKAGACIAKEIESSLLEEEPEDIHMEIIWATDDY